MPRSAVLIAVVVVVLAAGTSSALGTTTTTDPVLQAAANLQQYFSNITFLTSTPGLGSLFTPTGTWCSQMGAPCTTGAANITAYALSFKHHLGLTDANARFTGLSVTANYGSFDYTKTFTCTSPCGMRTCIVPGKSGFHIDAATGLIVELDDYVDATEFQSYCLTRCTVC